MTRKYNKFSKLDFGQYKGYEVGLIFATHPDYFEWCIENIRGFHIEGLEELIAFGCVGGTEGWQVGLIGPEMNQGLNVWDSYADFLADCPDGGSIPIEFSEELISKNNNNKRF